MRYIVTGGAGFFGSLLVETLLEHGHEVMVVDRLFDAQVAGRTRFSQTDLRDADALDRELKGFGPIDGVFHIAAMLAHAKNDLPMLWESNVTGTKNLLETCSRLGVGKLVFTGSNCIFSSGSAAPVKEDATPAPAEIYGRSKLEGEKLILAYGEKVPYSIIRCPTIIAAGRLGLLSILFDFIREGRRVWLIGKGDNRYQFIYARDLAGACLLAMQNPGRQQVFNIGSDSVPTLGGAFAQLIQHAGSGSKLVSVPRAPALAAMRLAYLLGLSPLGPYHYRMIAENFVFDTTHIKTTLGWKPSVTNGEMLIEAYQWYLENYNEITREQGCSAHRSRARMGIISLIKAIS